MKKIWPEENCTKVSIFPKSLDILYGNEKNGVNPQSGLPRNLRVFRVENFAFKGRKKQDFCLYCRVLKTGTRISVTALTCLYE